MLRSMRAKEGQELAVAVPREALGKHHPGEHVEGGEQGGRAVALESWVMVPARPGFMGRLGWVRGAPGSAPSRPPTAPRRPPASPKTVGHHVEHIYTKTGVTTRAGATLFAMEHGLLAI